MGSVIPTSRLNEILATPLNEIPSILGAAVAGLPEAEIETAALRARQTIAGNAAALAQQLCCAADNLVGWAPWQVDGIVALASLDTLKLAAGTLIDALFNVVVDVLEDALRQLALAVEDFLAPFLGFVTAWPVIGQVLDIVIGLVKGIADLVTLAKKSQAITDAETEFPPLDGNALLLQDDNAVWRISDLLRNSGDWSRLWQPYASYYDSINQWNSGFGCQLLTDGGRRIGPSSSTAWMLPTTAEGAVPGTANIHRAIQLGYNPASSNDVFDTGRWMPNTRSAALQAWSLLWAKGPATFTVDPHQVAVAWGPQYIEPFLRDLDNKTTCGLKPNGKEWMIRPDTRAMVRESFLRTISPTTKTGVKVLPRNASIEQVLDEAAPFVAMRLLAERQTALIGTSLVAYVDARFVPARLRPLIEQRQADFLTSDDVCRTDPRMVKDPEYRAALELTRSRKGFVCTGVAGSTIQGPVPEAERWDSDSPTVPPPPPPPQLPPPPRLGGGASSTSSSSSSTDTTSSTSGRRRGGAAVAALALLGGAFLLTRRRR